ncbi:MAG: hypothetical protein DI538_31345 [Azospira oryzae]|nr:MAG: hypothetical protein DI538_31345 [Azospira oryzae]
MVFEAGDSVQILVKPVLSVVHILFKWSFIPDLSRKFLDPNTVLYLSLDGLMLVAMRLKSDLQECFATSATSIGWRGGIYPPAV